jgi:hypothetical protein
MVVYVNDLNNVVLSKPFWAEVIVKSSTQLHVLMNRVDFHFVLLLLLSSVFLKTSFG